MSQHKVDCNIFQESSRKRKRSAEVLEEQRPTKDDEKIFPEKINAKQAVEADLAAEADKIFLILPSYAERFKKDTQSIIATEKKNKFTEIPKIPFYFVHVFLQP